MKPDNKNASVTKSHPWLKIHSSSIEEYIPPRYYEKLLKDYVFHKKTDLEYLKHFLESLKNPRMSILELGSGSGRATDILLRNVGTFKNLDLVDLSPHMIAWLKNKYRNNKNIRVVRSDSVKYLEKTKKKYDFVFSFWSFSHSIHQHMEKSGLKRVSEYLEKCLIRFFTNNLNPGGKFFLFHFDSKSDEQKILMKQWGKFFPIFRDTRRQSPSKLLLDDILKRLQKKKIIEKLEIKHLSGDPISYESLEEALEIFINFHMETEFNRSPRIGEILKEVSSDINKHKIKNGHFLIKPGCFVYTFQKANTKVFSKEAR
ncbi:MAG: class I SAM-dependent methyltransferase [Candidatus Paceibacterota bacterium]